MAQSKGVGKNVSIGMIMSSFPVLHQPHLWPLHFYFHRSAQQNQKLALEKRDED